MLTLNKNYINNQFKFPGTDILVILDGIYQPALSSLTSDLTFNGTTLEIPKDSNLGIPLHLLFLTAKDWHNTFEITAEPNSTITIIEEHVSLGEEIPYTNEAKIHINAKINSKIVHYKLQFANTDHATCQTTVNIDQAAGSVVSNYFISKGAHLTNDVVNVTLAGEHAYYESQGINLLRQQQNMSNQICVKHLAPNCTSNVLSKSIIDDQAINNFDCRIIAYNGATKTETHVTNKNLLLSSEATANTAPALEIYVDDVICTHGATVGQLDDEALFYLRCRGITKDAATKILIAAFVQEITDRFTNYNRFKIAAGLVYA